MVYLAMEVRTGKTLTASRDSQTVQRSVCPVPDQKESYPVNPGRL